ncbi:3-keto-disaccharide hydrolase [Sinomicrobium sp. M5D2P9]
MKTKNRVRQFALLSLAVMAFSCKTDTDKKTSPEKVTDEKATQKNQSKGSEWVYLFDGTTTKGWRGYNMDSLPPGWTIKDSTLTFDTELGLEQNYEGGKDIIYGAEEFDNFELYLEWKLPEGGNSGIFYHVKEGYDGPPVVSPEYQLIDDENYASIHDLTAYNTSLGYTEKPEELKPLQQTGADYAMHPPAADKILHPVGEWNSSRIVFTPEKVEHWLNGQLVLSFVPWDEAWYEKKNSDKWKNSPDYGKFKTGYIALQDHSSPIWFRNIKIKKL